MQVGRTALSLYLQGELAALESQRLGENVFELELVFGNVIREIRVAFSGCQTLICLEKRLLSHRPRAYPTPTAIDDVPGSHCTFGEHGWTNDKVNVITAINNMTRVLMDPHKT